MSIKESLSLAGKRGLVVGVVLIWATQFFDDPLSF